MNTGGATEAKKIAAITEADHVSFAPHNSQDPVATAINAHVDSAVPNFFIQEVFQSYDVDWLNDLLDNPPVIDDGFVEIPDSPGFGIELQDEIVEEHAYTEDKVHTITLFEKDWEKREIDRR